MLFKDWQVSIVLFLNKYVLGEVSTLTFVFTLYMY